MMRVAVGRCVEGQGLPRLGLPGHRRVLKVFHLLVTKSNSSTFSPWAGKIPARMFANLALCKCCGHFEGMATVPINQASKHGVQIHHPPCVTAGMVSKVPHCYDALSVIRDAVVVL